MNFKRVGIQIKHLFFVKDLIVKCLDKTGSIRQFVVLYCVHKFQWIRENVSVMEKIASSRRYHSIID